MRVPDTAKAKATVAKAEVARVVFFHVTTKGELYVEGQFIWSARKFKGCGLKEYFCRPPARREKPGTFKGAD